MFKKRKALAAPLPLGRIIGQVMEDFGPRQRTPLARIWEQWGAVLGGPIAANTRPVALKRGVLLVNVTSSVWLQELQFCKADMLRRLCAALNQEQVKGRVTEIRFKIGPV